MQASLPPEFLSRARRVLLPLAAVVAVAGLCAYAWRAILPGGPGPGFISGNGRIEATEIDVASKYPGRLQDILVDEGDTVASGQPLAHMQLQTLQAQREEAQAHRQQALAGISSAQAQVAVRESDAVSAQAQVEVRETDLDAARIRLRRSETLSREGAASEQELDDDRARARSAAAALAAAQAQLAAARSAVAAARTQVAGAQATARAADATVARVQADIEDSTLTAPRAGRVQYRIAQAGEVVGAGGKVLNLLDLSDVTMTFFVPEAAAGRLALGSEVRIVLDAAPQYVIPAQVSFVADTAQFTPKTVETASERQKLMFKVKAQISRELLQKHLQRVKSGLPGTAWLRIDPQAPWPASLAVKVPE
jgi:HlyD family secretion protein